MGHAKAIVALKDKKLIKALADTAIKEQWSVRELEEEVKKLEEKADTKKAKQKPKRKDPYIDQVEENLREMYRTTVKIRHSNNKGKIELLYYSNDDLNRLLELLQGKTS